MYCKGEEPMKKGERIIEEYEINPYTLLVKPIAYGSKTYSYITELDAEFISPFKPIEIIKYSCEYYGSSYEGRKEGTRSLTGITHKSPIAIDPTSSIFFFPTHSPASPQCMWVSHEHISSIFKHTSKESKILFRNRCNVTIPVSFGTIENQILRTALLKTRLVQRIAETERKMYYIYSERNRKSLSQPIDLIEK